AAGIEPHLVAGPGGGSALVAAFPPGAGTVVLPGASEPSPEPAAGLRALGWTVLRVPVYRTVAAALPNEVIEGWSGYDAFLVTAGSVARAAVAAAGLPGPRVVAIGGSAAAAAREVGLEVAAVAASPDTDGLVEAVAAALG
ncbi:MAG: uroporphyrinogen-III synthase, partial [Propionicimonas sp.]